jgi:hypothetical protein
MVLAASALAGLVGRRKLRQMGSAQRFPLFLLFCGKLSADCLAFAAEILASRGLEAGKTARGSAVLPLFSAVMATADARTASTALGPNLWD